MNKNLFERYACALVFSVVAAGLALFSACTGSKFVPVPTDDGDGPVSVTEVKIKEGNKLTLNPGSRSRLTAEILPDNASDKSISWSSDNERAATISSDGSVTAVAPGEATITITTRDGNHTASLALRVGMAASGVRIDYFGVEGITSLTLLVGEKETMTAALLPTGAIDEPVWRSSNPAVATIDQTTGEVEAKTIGTAKISVMAGTQQAEFELTVAAAGTPPHIIDKTESDLRLMARRLNAIYTLSNDITLTKEWTPIGNINTPFSGTLDGVGFTIRNLFIDKPNENLIGLIGQNTGTIKDIGVELSATGIKGDVVIGGLAGNNDGGYVSGVVSGAGAISGTQTRLVGTNESGFVGGLVGTNKSGGTVVGISLVDVNGINGWAGGLVGYNDGGSVKGYATGNVGDNPSGGSSIGGLTGQDYGGTLVGYYAGKTVQGIYSVAGLSGGAPKIVTGYARGAVVVSSNNNVGPAVANNSSATTLNAYYSGNESTVRGGTSNGVGTSITVDGSTVATDFSGFDFINDWEFILGKWPAIRFPAESIFNNYRGDKQPIDP